MTDSTSQPIIIGVLALQGAFAEHIAYINHCLPSSSTSRVTAIPIRSAEELSSCSALVIPGGESTVIQSVATRTPGMLPALQAFVRDPSRAVWGTCAGMILMAEEDGVGGGKVIPGRERQRGWGGIEGLNVWRNLYGNQLESFEAPLLIPDLSNPSEPFPAIFIRAPAVHSLHPKSLVDHTSPSDPTSSSSSQTQLLTPASTPPRQSSPSPTPRSSQPVIALATLPAEYHPAPPPSDSHLGEPSVEDLGKVMLRQGKKLVTSFHPELSGDVRVHRYWVEACVLGDQ